jgi:hypothetical protein
LYLEDKKSKIYWRGSVTMTKLYYTLCMAGNKLYQQKEKVSFQTTTIAYSSVGNPLKQIQPPGMRMSQW